MTDTTSTSQEQLNPPAPSVTDRDSVLAALRAVPADRVEYDRVFEVGRFTFAQLVDADTIDRRRTYLFGRCADCQQMFVFPNNDIVAVRANATPVEGDDVPWPYLHFLHADCWEARKDNWGKPRPVPPGPISWEVSDAKPGYPTVGYVPTDSEGTVTLSIHGQPLIGVDLQAGTVFTCPDGEERQVVAWFAAVP